jgi:GR25 family glycosyltransferase involved in LPS biosynthesis
MPSDTSPRPPARPPSRPGSRRSSGGVVVRVKLLADWCSSEELCRLWDKMTQGALRWNDIEVTWHDEAIDYYAVINGLRPIDRCVPERTFLFSMEPPVRREGRREPPIDPRPFLQVRDHRTHLPPLEWHLGQTYAELKAASPAKSRVLSAVVSSRRELPGHGKRIAFLRFLESRGLALDLYGHRNDFRFASYVGPLPPHRKDDGILPYRYTFNAENQAVPNYVTEKLADAILGESLCFYWGCPNVQDHLDPRAYVALDLDDFEGSHRRMVDAIRDDEWSRRLPFIRREKQRILDRLQFFPVLEQAIREHERAAAALASDRALEQEVPYLLRRHRLTAARQTGASATAAVYLRTLFRPAEETAVDRGLLLVTGGVAATPDLADRCAAVTVGASPADEAQPPPDLDGRRVSYRCGSGRIELPRAWLTIEDDVPVKVINLDRRSDRWARTVEVLAAAGLRRYARVAAQDGRALRPDVDDLRLFRGNHFGWRRGVIGCALSHLGLWRALAACPDPEATWLVLEDDVAFAPSFLGEWSRRHDEVGQLDPRWDLLFLGLHVDRFPAGLAGGRAAGGAGALHRVERLGGTPPGVLGGTFAYAIRRAGAWRLLEWVAQEGIRVPIDAFILHHLAGLRAFVVAPNLVFSDHVGSGPTVDSDVQRDSVAVEGVSW